MFHKPLVAYDESAELSRALDAGIDLAKRLGVDLYAVTVEEGLPKYVTAVAPYATYVNQAVIDELDTQRDRYYGDLQQKARERAQSQGVTLHTTVVTGDEVESICVHARDLGCDLLLVGYHHHSTIADRFLATTVHGLEVEAPCSVLIVK